VKDEKLPDLVESRGRRFPGGSAR